MRFLSSPVKAFVAAGLMAATLAVPSAAIAQTAEGVSTASGPGTTIPPEVQGTTVVPQTSTTVPDEVLGTTVVPEVLDNTVSNSNLALTGSDVTGLTIFSLGAIALGSALLVSRRRRNASL